MLLLIFSNCRQYWKQKQCFGLYCSVQISINITLLSLLGHINLDLFGKQQIIYMWVTFFGAPFGHKMALPNQLW